MSRHESHGYVIDTSYTDRFFRELSPAWLNYAAALNGVRPPALDGAFTYLELGCGFGHSIAVNAGAFPRAEFHACDFNPAHVEGGRRRAAALALGNIQFHEASFQDLLSLDLPSFDYITLHGVYSWVGTGARHAIRRVILDKLKPGGLVYVSYNCLPGWAIEMPLRRLLMELAIAERGDTRQRAERALGLLTQLTNGKLRYFTANAAAGAAVDAYTRGPSNYLVHEFLNEAWEPFYSVDVAEEMAGAQVRYAGSATLADNHDALVVPDSAAAAVATLPAARQRQLAMDFAANRRFRRDVFVRVGANRGSSESTHPLDDMAIGCADNPDRIAARVQVPRGAISFQEPFVADLRTLMHRGSTTFADAVAALAAPGRHTGEIRRNLTFLVAAGTLTPFASACRQSPAVAARRPRNATVARALAHAVEHNVATAVPSEILGNGILITQSDAAALIAWLGGEDAVAAPVVDDLVPSLARLGVIV